ncbi:MAG: hypothetical protein ACRDD8_05355 [Bacteroidales bacterium]
MNCLLIGDKNRIFNKTNTDVIFDIAEPISITLTGGAESTMKITHDDNGNLLTKDAYIMKNINNEDVAILLKKSDKVFSNWDVIYVPEGEDCEYIIKPSTKKHLVDFYDDMSFTFNNFIFRVKINGKIAEPTTEYQVSMGKVVINKTSSKLNMANNVIEIITHPNQSALTATVSYDGYNDNSFIEAMFSSLSDAPLNNEIQLSSKKRRGLSNDSMIVDGGGVLSLQLYSLDGMNDYSILKEKRFKVTIRNDKDETIYHNCKIRHGASSVEEEVNTSSYDIEYGYKTKGGNQ